MQAFIITAYHNGELLERNLRLFAKEFRCFVHIDSGSQMNNQSYLSRLNEIENVKAISKYKINWGSYLHMMAILELLKMAMEDEEITRVHIISGEDIPIKSIEEFSRFFEEENRYKNFIELTDIREMPVMRLRYEKYHFQHIFNRQSSNVLVKYTDKVIRQIQYHIPFKRKTKFAYKGLVWSSLSIEGVRRVVEYITPKRIKILKYCETAEEFMIQNALMGSDLEDTVVTDKLRYNDWSNCKTGPKVLTMEYYDDIKETNAFFARKIQWKSGNKSADQLYERLYEDFAYAIK